MTLGRPRFLLDSKENMWAQEFSSLASQILSFDAPLRKIQTNKPLLETKTHSPKTQSLPNKNTQNTFETICCRPCSVPDMVGKFCRNMWTQRQPYSRKSLEGNPKTLSSWRYVSWKLGLWAKFNIHVHFFRK